MIKICKPSYLVNLFGTGDHHVKQDKPQIWCVSAYMWNLDLKIIIWHDYKMGTDGGRPCHGAEGNKTVMGGEYDWSTLYIHMKIA
jgi:hypothetical protein